MYTFIYKKLGLTILVRLEHISGLALFLNYKELFLSTSSDELGLLPVLLGHLWGLASQLTSMNQRT